MSNEMLNKWSAQAWALQGPIDALRAPFHVLAGEAMDVAHFAKHNWDQGIDEAATPSVRGSLPRSAPAGSRTRPRRRAFPAFL